MVVRVATLVRAHLLLRAEGGQLGAGGAEGLFGGLALAAGVGVGLGVGAGRAQAGLGHGQGGSVGRSLRPHRDREDLLVLRAQLTSWRLGFATLSAEAPGWGMRHIRQCCDIISEVR